MIAKGPYPNTCAFWIIWGGTLRAPSRALKNTMKTTRKYAVIEAARVPVPKMMMITGIIAIRGGAFNATINGLRIFNAVGLLPRTSASIGPTMVPATVPANVDQSVEARYGQTTGV